jgi:ABC-type lipoprotein export system ATPase subunit
MSEAVVLVVSDVHKSYRSPAGSLKVLSGVTLEVSHGERVAIQGASGSGKSTLLYVVGGLAKPDSGTIVIGGRSVGELSKGALSNFRRTQIGIIFQRSNLLSGLNLTENVLLPLRLNGVSGKAALEQADNALRRVGLAPRVNHRVSELSEGEKQRGAIARALVHRPAVLLADEPTGSLDPSNRRVVLDVFDSLEEVTLVIVTHDDEVAARCRTRYALSEGILRRL